MWAMWAWVERYGIPQALYVGWKNVYVTQRETTLEEQLSGELPLTRFRRACKKLGIEILPASSPQANDWVMRYKKRFFQIGLQSNLPPARRRVRIQEHLDGTIHIAYRDREVSLHRDQRVTPEILIKNNKSLD